MRASIGYRNVYHIPDGGWGACWSDTAICERWAMKRNFCCSRRVTLCFRLHRWRPRRRISYAQHNAENCLHIEYFMNSKLAIYVSVWSIFFSPGSHSGRVMCALNSIDHKLGKINLFRAISKLFIRLTGKERTNKKILNFPACFLLMFSIGTEPT